MTEEAMRGTTTAPLGEKPDGEESIKQKAEDIKHQLTEQYHELEGHYESTKDQLYDVNRRAVEFIAENPAVSIAAAFGVGYVIGKLASRRWFV